MPHDPYKALYIHLPFCKHRCAYCDFSTQAIDASSPQIGEYIEGLILDIRRKAKEGELGSDRNGVPRRWHALFRGHETPFQLAVYLRRFHESDA